MYIVVTNEHNGFILSKENKTVDNLYHMKRMN